MVVVGRGAGSWPPCLQVHAVMSDGEGPTLNHHIPTANSTEWEALFYSDK